MKEELKVFSNSKADISGSVRYRDTFLVVLEKPSGLVVNRAKSAPRPTLQDLVEKKFRLSGSDSVFVARSGIVHRLDKDTSGLIIVALDEAVFFSMQKQFKAREIQKEYICLVHGDVVPKKGVISEPVGRDPYNRMRFRVLSEGKEAETRYRVLRAYCRGGGSATAFGGAPQEAGGPSRETPQRGASTKRTSRDLSLLACRPKTGRTHQIRVHMKYLGYPIVSDPLYVGRKNYREDIKFCPRLFLHASKITFKHPVSGKVITLESSLPEDLQKVLDNVYCR
jgi:23S rRNA pseudouridine1911/1915/1917 synthase